jgi:hypothetical protein
VLGDDYPNTLNSANNLASDLHQRINGVKFVDPTEQNAARPPCRDGGRAFAFLGWV